MFERLLGERGAPPTIREVADRLEVEPPVAFRYLKTLVRKGILEKFEGGFKLPGPLMRAVPVLGTIHAGTLHEALESPDGYVPCPPGMARGRTLFGLRVKGDSMIDAQIAEKDIVICEKTERADAGEIIVALHQGEATVKRLSKVNGRPALIAENGAKQDSYPPILLDQESRILGKVMAVFRTVEPETWQEGS